MFLQRLQVQGYRSLASVNWEPGKLNVLVGPNASGKTNLLRCFLLLKRSALGNLEEAIRSEGGMDPLVWNQTAQGISWSCDTAGDLAADPAVRWRYELEIQRLGSGPGYLINREMLYGADRSATGGTARVLLERAQNGAKIAQGEKLRELDRQELQARESVLSLLSAPIGIDHLVHQFHQEIGKWAIHQSVDIEAMRLATVVSYDTTLKPDGSNLISALHTKYETDRTFKTDLDAAMSAAFGADYEQLVFPPAADQRIQLRIRWRSLKREQSAADLSDGTLRFLYLLTALSMVPKGSLLAIEEPETGLHPSMMPIVAEYAAEAARGSQVILTTHSPSLLDALGEHDPAVTVFDWESGRSELKRLSGDELTFWLSRFTLGEVFRSGRLETLG